MFARLATAALFGIQIQSAAETFASPSVDDPWSLERIRAASTDDLARWSLGVAPETFTSHRVSYGHVNHTPWIEFRTSPVDLGQGACSDRVYLARLTLPLQRPGQTGDGSRIHVEQVLPPRTLYHPTEEDGGCDVWGSTFQAPSDAAASRALETWARTRDAVNAGGATLECDETIPNCNAVFASLSVTSLRQADACEDGVICGSFAFNAGSQGIWNVAVDDLAGVRVRIRRGPPPPAI